jgi:hypothetical protein
MAKKPKKAVTPDEILKKWKKASQSGLGIGKKFEKAIFDTVDPLLVAKIADRLNNGFPFDKAAEKGTKQVAKDLGKICRMLTKDKSVTLATFKVVFAIIKTRHPGCPVGGAGGGAWCDINF